MFKRIIVNLASNLAWICAAPIAFASSDAPFVFGHNLSPTTDMLERGQTTLGDYAIAYGVTEHLMLGTSPWIDIAYNMPMVSVRYGSEFARGPFDAVMVQFNFFRSAHYFEDAYQQESTWLGLTVKEDVTSYYSAFFTLTHQYFFSEGHPFSLRGFAGNDDSYNLSLTSLHQFRIGQHFGLHLEVGALGINYQRIYFHQGLSTYYSWGSGYLQLGFSQSKRLNNDTNDQNYGGLARVNMHPELQLQFLL